jgi:hypothetical protein
MHAAVLSQVPRLTEASTEAVQALEAALAQSEVCFESTCILGFVQHVN